MVRICSVPRRAGGTAPADQLPMMTQLKIGGPTTIHRCHCEGVSPWQSASPAMRSIARPLWGRKENGLPRRRLAPRNDSGGRWLVLLLCTGSSSADGRRGQCRPPYGERSKTVPSRGEIPETLYKWAGYLQKTFDSPKKMCYLNRVQGSDEDTPRRKSPREEPIWCNGSVNGNRRIPLLSRPAEMPGRVRPLKRQ